MSTILDQARALREQVKRVANRESEAEVANTLASVSSALAEKVEQTAGLRQNLAVIRGAKIPVTGKLPTTAQIKDLHERIAAVKKRLIEERASLKQRNTWARCDDEAGKLLQLVNGALSGAWSEFVKERLCDTSSFATLRKLPSCAEPLRKVDEINTQIRGHERTLPTAAKEVQEVGNLGKRARDQVAKLKLSGMPRAVEEFLKLAAGNGAPLERLSDEVLDWLRHNPDFAASLRVTASSGRP